MKTFKTFTMFELDGKAWVLPYTLEASTQWDAAVKALADIQLVDEAKVLSIDVCALEFVKPYPVESNELVSVVYNPKGNDDNN